MIGISQIIPISFFYLDMLKIDRLFISFFIRVYCKKTLYDLHQWNIKVSDLQYVLICAYMSQYYAEQSYDFQIINKYYSILQHFNTRFNLYFQSLICCVDFKRYFKRSFSSLLKNSTTRTLNIIFSSQDNEKMNNLSN